MSGWAAKPVNNNNNNNNTLLQLQEASAWARDFLGCDVASFVQNLYRTAQALPPHRYPFPLPQTSVVLTGDSGAHINRHSSLCHSVPTLLYMPTEHWSLPDPEYRQSRVCIYFSRQIDLAPPLLVDEGLDS